MGGLVSLGGGKGGEVSDLGRQGRWEHSEVAR